MREKISALPRRDGQFAGLLPRARRGAERAAGDSDRVAVDNHIAGHAAAAESLEEQARALVQAVSMFRLSAADVQAAPEPPIRAELAPVTRIPAAKDKPAARKASAPLPKVRKVAGAGGAEPEDEWEEF